MPAREFEFVARGWTATSLKYRTIAEAEAKTIYEDPSRAVRLLTDAQSNGVAKLSRESLLRCLVAIQSQPFVPNLESLGIRIFARQDRWASALTATEYKWRTFAVKSLTRDPRLFPAYERILKAAPNDYRAELGYDHLLLFNGNGDVGLPRMRRLASRYPNHVGTQIYLARLIADYAIARRDLKLYDESTRILDRMVTLPANPTEKRDLADARERNAFGRSYTFGRR